jgi:ureidoacrylate peracid hydrolase
MDSRRVTIKAEPEPIEIEVERTAVLVVDMQNAFAARGGAFERWGADVSQGRAPIDNMAALTDTVRRRDGKVVYICHAYSADLRESGGEGSANWRKSRIVRDATLKPETRDSLPIRGHWGVDVIPPLAPKSDDAVVEKSRHSGFYETKLDATLKELDVKYLLVCGTEMSICVESTARDAFWRGYFVILVTDACICSPPFYRRDATIWNIRGGFGWVTTTDEVIKALAKPATRPPA